MRHPGEAYIFSVLGHGRVDVKRGRKAPFHVPEASFALLDAILANLARPGLHESGLGTGRRALQVRRRGRLSAFFRA